MLVSSSPEIVARQLRAWSSNRQMTMGVLEWPQSGGEPIRTRCEGGVLRAGTDAGPSLLLMRVLPHPAAIARFEALNRMIESLHREVLGRQQAEAELLRHAERLARSNAELQQFAYVTSHDLQEPLRTITSYAQLLERRYRDRIDSDANEIIDYVVNGVKRLHLLINELLTYSRIAGTENVLTGPVSMKRAIEWALANLRLLIEDCGAVVTCGELPDVRGNEVQLVQLWQNLVSNAIKYRRPGVPPRVQVNARVEDTKWIFSVEDNGIGIEPKHRERVFGLFKRLHGNEIPGVGIGLAICSSIVEKHGGRIWVESQPGVGSSFYFSIPKEFESPAADAGRERAEAESCRDRRVEE